MTPEKRDRVAHIKLSKGAADGLVLLDLEWLLIELDAAWRELEARAQQPMGAAVALALEARRLVDAAPAGFDAQQAQRAKVVLRDLSAAVLAQPPADALVTAEELAAVDASDDGDVDLRAEMAPKLAAEVRRLWGVLADERLGAELLRDDHEAGVALVRKAEALAEQYRRERDAIAGARDVDRALHADTLAVLQTVTRERDEARAEAEEARTGDRLSEEHTLALWDAVHAVTGSDEEFRKALAALAVYGLDAAPIEEVRWRLGWRDTWKAVARRQWRAARRRQDAARTLDRLLTDATAERDALRLRVSALADAVHAHEAVNARYRAVAKAINGDAARDKASPSVSLVRTRLLYDLAAVGAIGPDPLAEHRAKAKAFDLLRAEYEAARDGRLPCGHKVEVLIGGTEKGPDGADRPTVTKCGACLARRQGESAERRDHLAAIKTAAEEAGIVPVPGETSLSMVQRLIADANEQSAALDRLREKGRALLELRDKIADEGGIITGCPTASLLAFNVAAIDLRTEVESP